MSQRVIISPDENGNNPVVIADLSQNQNMLPVNLSYHEATTIQTHNAVSVAATTGISTNANFIDCLGYSDIAVNLLNDATTASSVNIEWSTDGVTLQGGEAVLAVATGSSRRSASTPVKARYAKITLYNTDAAAHTMSAWAFLKA